MVLNRELRIRISKAQHELIKQQAELEGRNISSLCREKILLPNHALEKMVRDIHEIVMKKN
jgi:uncharacterized protein (DUF1778 family)